MLLLHAVSVSASQLPKEDSRFIVNIEKSEGVASLNLRLANLEKRGTLILLQDTNGNIWFSQYVRFKHGYAKTLNLKGMPDGTYTLSVNHQGATVIQALRLSNGVLEVLEHQKMEVPALPKDDLVRKK